MKTMMIACALLLATAPGRNASAQDPDRPPRPEMKERLERLERMKQMRLIEELELGEEEAVRFMASMDIPPSKYHLLQLYTKKGTIDISLDEVTSSVRGPAGTAPI